MTPEFAPLITSEQVRAARGWLDISQQQLADLSLVNRRTIAQFERGASVPFDRTLRDIQRALQERGIEFLFDGPLAIGVRWKRPRT
jgi:transcriptional regulator with XRE-family HTH domain